MVLLSLKMESAHRAIIVVSHRLTTVQHANHIIVLDAGNVIKQGDHAELMARTTEGIASCLPRRRATNPLGVTG